MVVTVDLAIYTIVVHAYHVMGLLDEYYFYHARRNNRHLQEILNNKLCLTYVILEFQTKIKNLITSTLLGTNITLFMRIFLQPFYEISFKNN